LAGIHVVSSRYTNTEVCAMDEAMKSRTQDRVFNCLNTSFSIGSYTMYFDTLEEVKYAKHVGQNFHLFTP